MGTKKANFSAKIKLLKIYELLKQETDENHPISRQDLCAKLNQMGISSNVRTLSKDIQVLNEFGYNVQSFFFEREKFYFIDSSDFSISELKIILDAIHAACFIPENLTQELSSRILNLAGSQKKTLLTKSMVCFNTRKHSNIQTLNTVDHIQEAIVRKKQIQYLYFDLDEHREHIYRKTSDGVPKIYVVEPIALVFHEDNYYLIAYSSHHPDSTTNYRVDRMENVEIIEDQAISPEALKKQKSISRYTEQTFKMYSGKETLVTLVFDSTLLGPVYDKFGENISIERINDTTCKLTVPINVSPIFYGWVFQFAGKMKISAPEEIVEEYNHMRGTNYD